MAFTDTAKTALVHMTSNFVGMWLLCSCINISVHQLYCQYCTSWGMLLFAGHPMCHFMITLMGYFSSFHTYIYMYITHVIINQLLYHRNRLLIHTAAATTGASSSASSSSSSNNE